MDEKDQAFRLAEALSEIEKLRRENKELRRALALSNKPVERSEPEQTNAVERGTFSLSIPQKIALFRSLFKGREDVYALRWESSRGISGYSPAHHHMGDDQLCRRPRRECEKLGQRLYFPLTDDVIYEHLVGKQTVGIYPLLKDDTCNFLAVDFDRESWTQDAAAFLVVCRNRGILAYLERSRSGKGAHIWFFFERSIAAGKARSLGALLLGRASANRYQIGLESYDRMFPNQDLLPKGGFGNLIALPLQKAARANENSVFLDDSMQPVLDQWRFLAKVRRLKAEQVDAFIDDLNETGEPDMELHGPEPGNRSAESRVFAAAAIASRVVSLRYSNMVFLEKRQLPSPIVHELTQCASFRNPEYYRAQRLRLSVFDKPRNIICMEDSGGHLAFPRGCLPRLEEILGKHGFRIKLEDQRIGGSEIDVKFLGTLRDHQQQAYLQMSVHDTGVLSASTAFGKTIVAIKLIACRAANTLIVVHRKQILEHWREKLLAFTSLEEEQLGVWGSGKKRRTGVVDIAMLQSLVRQGEVQELVQEYGHVVVDECHHVPAFNFEQVMKKAKGRFVLGLTATPVRKDGHHPIIFMQCGPVRFKTTERAAARKRGFDHVVIPRNTHVRIAADESLSLHSIYDSLMRNPSRNKMIADDAIKVVGGGRTPLVISERKEHLSMLGELLSRSVPHVFYLHGTMKRRKSRETLEAIGKLPRDASFVLLATGKFVGEGFDEPRLDTLFLTLPISWKGTLQQYAGRLHREYDEKREVRIYDYFDMEDGILGRMYKKRLAGYKSIGYRVDS